MDSCPPIKKVKRGDVEEEEEPKWITHPAPKPSLIGYHRRTRMNKALQDDSIVQEGDTQDVEKFPLPANQKVREEEHDRQAPQANVAQQQMYNEVDAARQDFISMDVALQDASIVQEVDAQDGEKFPLPAEVDATQQGALMAPKGYTQERQILGQKYAVPRGRKDESMEHACLWSHFLSSISDVSMVERAFKESAYYQNLLLQVDQRNFLSIEDGYKLKLPMSCIFSGIGKEPKPSKASYFTFVVRAKELSRLAQFLGMKRLLPPPVVQGCMSPLSGSQGSSSTTSLSSEELGSVGSNWTYITGCTGCGLTILALELALRLRRNSEPVLFIRAGSHEAFLSLAQSVAMTVVGMQDNSMLKFIKKACFDADGKLMKDMHVFKQMLISYVGMMYCAGTCKAICIVDNGHVFYEDANNPFSQLLMLLKEDSMWNRWCQTIVFGRRSIYSDAFATKCHIVDTRLELECVCSLLSKKKIELQDDEIYELEMTTGFLAKDIVSFMELWVGNFEDSICAFKEMKCRMLSSAIPLALSKLPEVKAALIPRGLLLMRLGIAACGGKLPFEILWDYMYIKRTNAGDIILPTSELVGSFLWTIVMESRGEKSGFETVSHICEHIIKNKELFGRSVVGKCTEILITSYINAYGRFNVVASSLTNRKKRSLDYKGMPSMSIAGNKVPSLDLNSIMFLWFTSPSFPCIDAMIVDQKLKRAIAMQVTTMPINMHANEFYGNSNDNSKVCQGAEWAKILQIPKDNVLELWIGLEQMPGSRDWTDCSYSWATQPSHFYVSISDVIAKHSPHLDALKPLYY